MTAAQRSKFSAIVLFLLIAAVVVGGMAWGTVVTFRLTEYNIEENRGKEIRRVVSVLDSHMRSTLLQESVRPFTDYNSHAVPAVAKEWLDWIRSVLLEIDDQESSSSTIVSSCANVLLPMAEERFRKIGAVLAQDELLRSPLSEPHPESWIELYFQVDDGRWSSPQVMMDEPGLWVGYSSGSNRQGGARQRLDWFSQQMPMFRMAERVSAALARDRVGDSGGEEKSAASAVTVSPRALKPGLGGGNLSAGPTSAASEFRQRAKSRAREQMKARPPTQAARVNPGSPPNQGWSIGGGEGPAEQPLSCISMSRELPATFWLNGMPGEGKKLAFVRTAYRDDKVVYQGFLGDWARIKNELLDKLEDALPGADLIPLEDDAVLQDAASEADLTWIPARVSIPDPAESVAAQAWGQVGGMLITTWIAAAVVLGVAGTGVRNLVALTERRMQFAYAVTHELRTPLTTFRLYSDMLSSGLVPAESQKEYLDTLNHESERLTTLVESVLEYSRLENHKVRLNPVTTDGSRLLEKLDETLRERCRSAGVQPQSQNLVPPGQTFVIDVEIVNQIAGVLIHNACRHARGAKSPAVILQLASEGDRLHLDVIDTGPGIDRADRRVIFKPFRRGRGADSSAQGGVGLGLALARTWAKFLHGRLDLLARRHTEYGGAHFRLTVPAMMG